MIYISKSLSETEEIAANFAKTLHGGEFIGLMGDLGAGKTAFVKGVAKQLGVKTKIKSPTFTIINEYPVDYKNIKKIVHADFYRLLNPEQIEALNFSDYQNDSTIIFVEWPDIFGEGVLSPDKIVKFKFVDENTREIEY